jgi:hypothetical protein
MALSVHLYSKSRGNGQTAINEIYHMMYTVDPALAPSDTEAERLALAMTKLESVTGLSFPSNYFDQAEQLIGPSAGGVIALDDEMIHWEGKTKVVST